MKLIEKLLNEVTGARSELARQLGVTNSNLTWTLQNPNNTLKTKKRYTQWFNECFETNYKYFELFSEVTEE